MLLLCLGGSPIPSDVHMKKPKAASNIPILERNASKMVDPLLIDESPAAMTEQVSFPLLAGLGWWCLAGRLPI